MAESANRPGYLRRARTAVGLTVYKARQYLSMSPAERRRNRESIAFTTMMEANDEAAYEAMYADPKNIEHYLVGARLEFFDQVADRVARRFAGDPKAAACLDVGCGTGHLLAALRRKGFAGPMLGLDTASSAARCVASHDLDIGFRHGYLSQQGFGSDYDLILCTEVLEHCDRPGPIVSEMIRVCRPSGLVVITVPDGRKDTWDGHIHFWSPESFRLFIGAYSDAAEFDYFEDTNYCVIPC